MGFPGDLDGKSQCRDLGLISGLGKSPGGVHGNSLQYFCLENPHGKKSLAGYSPWDHKESDMTEQLSTHTYLNSLMIFPYFIQYKPEFSIRSS